MAEEEKVVEAEEQAEAGEEEKRTTTEEIKVQAEDLFQTINQIIREGTAKRVMILRHDRVLVDIPLVIGVGASVLLALRGECLAAAQRRRGEDAIVFKPATGYCVAVERRCLDEESTTGGCRYGLPAR